MPGGDRTGPMGLGPMTGRGSGYCTGHSMPGYANPAGGRGYHSWGVWGRGRGYRHWYHATGLAGWARASRGMPAWGGYGWQYPAYSPPSISPQQEMEMLKAEAEGLEQGLKEIRKRMEELEKTEPKK